MNEQRGVFSGGRHLHGRVARPRSEDKGKSSESNKGPKSLIGNTKGMRLCKTRIICASSIGVSPSSLRKCAGGGRRV